MASLLLQVANELSQKVKSSRARVVDLCCGVGISTRALRHAFPDAETVMGIDTVSRARAVRTRLILIWLKTSCPASCEVVGNDFHGIVPLETPIHCEAPRPTRNSSVDECCSCAINHVLAGQRGKYAAPIQILRPSYCDVCVP